MSAYPENSQIINYLQSCVSDSTLLAGVELFRTVSVKDCTRSGAAIHGTVSTDSDDQLSVNLRILSNRQMVPSCSCGQKGEGTDSWCEHAVALALQASELSFLNVSNGNGNESKGFHISPSSGTEISEVIRSTFETSQPAPQGSEKHDIKLVMDLSSDRLGVQVLFDGKVLNRDEVQPGIKLSERVLDNLLIEILDEEGNWDENLKIWYVNSSHGIGIVTGLLPEFKNVISLTDGKPVTLAKDQIEAKMAIQWLKHGAELVMSWIMPDGTSRLNVSELLGSDPFWVAIDNTIYPVSARAARIASLFPSFSTITLQRSQIGPLLEALDTGVYDNKLIEIVNPDAQPLSRIKSPAPHLDFEMKQSGLDHFTSGRKLEIFATVDFEYPQPPAAENVVYLPDREKEKEVADKLISLGFEYRKEYRRYYLSESPALDLLDASEDVFPSGWEVKGLDQIKRKLKLSTLSIQIQLIPFSEGAPLEDFTKKDLKAAARAADWFDCQVHLTLNNARVPLSTIFKAGPADPDRWVRLDNGAFARVPGGSILQLKAILGMFDPNYRLSNTIHCRVSTPQALSLANINDPGIVVSLDKALRELARRLAEFEGIEKVKVSRNFKGKLRPYQEEGLSWLNFLNSFQFGGILADEMGLGKTVQTLAMLQHIKDRNKREKRQSLPSLVIAPTSVITNWLFETKRFAPSLNVLLLHGPERKKHFPSLREYDLVITSYALLRLDRYDLQKTQFNYLILDEAQLIKNFQATTTLAAKSLKANHRLALTGTPTENRPMELWSILDFLMPGYLGSADFFRNCYEKPILEVGPGVQIAGLLKDKCRPFILRRKKADVEKDLPPKIESLLPVEMADSQRELYNQIVNEVRPKVIEAIKQKGVAGASVSILAALLRLRQVCNHPNSIESLKNVAGYESGKFELWKDLIEEAISEGRKVLVFCQFLEMLSMMKGHLEHADIKHLYLDGATRDRQAVIDQFNNDESVRLFLISLKAGGLGLNLTSADMVVIFDPWWNPAVENQAVDRVHRIGQTKTVHVYRLITVDSVEQRIMDLKNRKSQIVDALINEGGISTLSLTKADIEGLLTPVGSGE